MEMQEPRLKVHEIYQSIQGESSLTGERFSFVRLTGCPLRCTYCDTEYAFTGGQWMNIPEIVDEVLKHQTRWVLLTGGEPLAQKNSLTLIHALREKNLNVTIETSGEIPVAPYVGLAKIIMDIKTPGSGEKAEKCFINLDFLQPTDEIKFVLKDESDYNWSKRICREYRLEDRFTVLFSPVFEDLPLKSLAEWMMRDRLNVRMQTQLHKLIWGKETKHV